MEIFKLVGSIMVDSAEAQNSISKTGDKAEGLSSKLVNGVTTAAKWAAGLTTAAVAVGGAMVAAAKDTASNLDVIDKASIRMGISAESYQELAYAAGLCGVEMSTMEKAAKKLEGTDINMDDAINQIMSAGDESERTAKAIELFGESVAYQMTPFIQAGADGLADMKAEANELGLVMSQDTVTAGAAMNDMFSKVDGSIQALKTSLVADLMPYVAEILQWVIDNMPVIQATVKSLIDALMPIVRPILDLIMAALPEILELVKVVADAILPIVQTLTSALTNLFQGLFSLLKGDTEGFVESFKAFFHDLATAMIDIGKLIFTNLWNGFKAIWEPISGWIKGCLNSAFEGVENFVNGIVRGLNKLVSGIGGIASSVGKFLGMDIQVNGLSEVSFPRLEKGGVLEKGQVGLLEGNGAEAVVPLENNKAWISAVAKDMDASLTSSDLKELTSLVYEIKSNLPSMLEDAFSKMTFDVNNREFARLVKAVN